MPPVSPRNIHRRQFQEAAATAIDRHAEAIQGTREFMAALSQRVDEHQQQITDLAADHALLKGSRGSLRGRLRWLFTGR